MSALEYTSHPAVRFSDHIPVTASLELASADPAACPQLTAFAPIVRFQTPADWRVGFDGVVSYFVEVGKMSYLDRWDYIGLYKVGRDTEEDGHDGTVPYVYGHAITLNCFAIVVFYSLNTGKIYVQCTKKAAQ